MILNRKPKQKQLLVISSYPPPGEIHGRYVVGVASYTKNTLLGIIDSSNVDPKPHITVLAEELNDIPVHYEEDDIEVNRMWKRSSIFSVPKILSYIFKHPFQSKKILIEFELAMFGGILALLPFPLMLILLKLMRKDISIVLHQVIPDVKPLSGHVNVERNSALLDIYNFGFSILYRIILACCKHVIVFDEALRYNLSKFGNTKNVVVIPHGVEEFDDLPTKLQARKELGIPANAFVVMSFGFLAWYKGSDWLVREWDELTNTYPHPKMPDSLPKPSNWRGFFFGFSGAQATTDDSEWYLNSRQPYAPSTWGTPVEEQKPLLVIAGGPNPNHINKAAYKKYVVDIQQECSKNGIMLSGFVPEDQIPLYYQAADVMVFPYRYFMSASGPLSLAISFKKPFLISEKLRPLFRTDDVNELLKKVGIDKELFVFETGRDFALKVKRFMSTGLANYQMNVFLRSLAQERTFEKIGALHYDTIFSPTKE